MGVQARLVRRVFGPECTGQGLIPKPYALSQWHVCFSFSPLEGTNQGSVHVKTDGTEIRLPLSTPLAVLPLPSLSRLPRNFLRNLCDLHSHLLSLNPVLIPPSTFPQLCQSAFFYFPPPRLSIDLRVPSHTEPCSTLPSTFLQLTYHLSLNCVSCQPPNLPTHISTPHTLYILSTFSGPFLSFFFLTSISESLGSPLNSPVLTADAGRLAWLSPLESRQAFWLCFYLTHSLKLLSYHHIMLLLSPPEND